MKLTRTLFDPEIRIDNISTLKSKSSRILLCDLLSIMVKSKFSYFTHNYSGLQTNKLKSTNMSLEARRCKNDRPVPVGFVHNCCGLQVVDVIVSYLKILSRNALLFVNYNLFADV